MTYLNAPALVAGVMLFSIPMAQAQSVEGTMRVSAYVGQSCTLSATPMAFGALTAGVDGFDAASAVITLDCSNPGTPTTVTIGNGADPEPANVRQMRSAGNLIGYTLYLENSATALTHDNVVTLSMVGTDASLFEARIDGQVPYATTYPDGVYVDTVTLTTTYTFTAL